MSNFKVTTGFEMTNGSVLSCEYEIEVIDARITGLPEDCYPAEADAGEPTYFVDGVELSYDRLPKGLGAIAAKLYEAQEGEFNYNAICLDY